ncbi:hypothetical protein FA15DRAFT_706562 [Coprinopsis marcescibilis]|uniref:Conserved oligomeric Golgi complex subunit 3 C-terminal domain-containing protein n=1 Tax=Coprinopsis marcescibilis TaxID=230819 RepID=A0A5C3KQ45_COPMA|nr:hypothetical protein FA15DRAFT_706562 [Coprinopsis marcescibilis]
MFSVGDGMDSASSQTEPSGSGSGSEKAATTTTTPHSEAEAQRRTWPRLGLQDAQTRLFIKVHALIQSDIKYHTPKREDLDIIVGLQETWYPTVRKMVWILSQVHDFVKPPIFEDIAQEAALLCRRSFYPPAIWSKPDRRLAHY